MKIKQAVINLKIYEPLKIKAQKAASKNPEIKTLTNFIEMAIREKLERI